jgi:hypothetical protein
VTSSRAGRARRRCALPRMLEAQCGKSSLLPLESKPQAARTVGLRS